MSIRSTLLTHLTTELANSSIAVSTKLPWESGNQPLYEKNMKTLFMDKPDQDITSLHPTLQRTCDVYQTETTINAYITVDAKQEPSDIDDVVGKVLLGKSIVADQFRSESFVDREIEEDRITYTFEYRFMMITQ